MTASLLNCGEETRFASSTARTATLIYVPVCFIILLFASSRRVLLVFSYIFTLLFIFCFACKTTAMFNRFVSIYGSIIAKNGGKKSRAERIFIYFLNVRFPPLAFSSLLTTWIVDALTGQWHSFVKTQRKGSRNVIKGFPFNDYSCVFPSIGW